MKTNEFFKNRGHYLSSGENLKLNQEFEDFIFSNSPLSKFNFNENDACYIHSLKCTITSHSDICLFSVSFIGTDASKTCFIPSQHTIFWFPRLSSVSAFLNTYSSPHSCNFWRKLLKRFPMYNYENALNLVRSHHEFEMWL